MVSDIDINKASGSAIQDSIAAYTAEYIDKSNEGGPRKALLTKQAPHFVLQSIDGGTFSLNDQRGKVVLLDFWETWCSPCTKSMPEVQKLFKKFGSRGLVVAGILCDGKNIDDAKKLIQVKKTTYLNLIGNEETANNYDVRAVPKYVLIDRLGKVIFEHEGFTENIEEMLNKEFSQK